jgi:hypothetical protein
MQFPCSAIPSKKQDAANADVVSEAIKKTSFLPKLFPKKSGKVLTEQNTNVLLEIFPLTRGGSLKFTLCD